MIVKFMRTKAEVASALRLKTTCVQEYAVLQNENQWSPKSFHNDAVIEFQLSVLSEMEFHISMY